MTLAGCRVEMTIPAIVNASSTTAVAIVTTRSALCFRETRDWRGRA